MQNQQYSYCLGLGLTLKAALSSVHVTELNWAGLFYKVIVKMDFNLN